MVNGSTVRTFIVARTLDLQRFSQGFSAHLGFTRSFSFVDEDARAAGHGLASVPLVQNRTGGAYLKGNRAAEALAAATKAAAKSRISFSGHKLEPV
jgi:hypothetical protein